MEHIYKQCTDNVKIIKKSLVNKAKVAFKEINLIDHPQVFLVNVNVYIESMMYDATANLVNSIISDASDITLAIN